MQLSDLIPTLQIAIGPVIMISGVGLLLLSMTNRFGRVIDRSRTLSHEIRVAGDDHRASILAQLEILLRRAHIVRSAIAFAALSLLMAALLIILLFISALMDLQTAALIVGLFGAGMVSLIAAILFFLADINLSLRALKLEVGPLDRHRNLE